MKCLILANTLIVMFISNFIFAQQNAPSDSLSKKILNLLDNSSLSAQIFMGYQYVNTGVERTNEFSINRGYLNYKKSLTKNLSGRITPDITIDREGDGMGDVEMRLKYCYMEYKHHGGKFFNEPTIIFGEVFAPWIEFEEKINQYRVLSALYLDGIKGVNSADFGFTFTSLIGGKVDEGYQIRVNNKYPGKYGSIALGVYNGGGYHALEVNRNKTIQWRYTLRPFPTSITGLQLTYTGAFGKGNTNQNPEYDINAGIVSYESANVVITGQLFTGKGNYIGDLTDQSGKSLKNNGYSLFSDINLYKEKFSLIGRYDFHRIYKSSGNISSDRFLVGLVYHIFDKNKILIGVDHTNYNGQNKPDRTIYELAVELSF